MSGLVVGVFGGAVAAAVTGIVAWLVSRRVNSGQVDTSDAAVLWQESASIRKDLRDEVVRLTARLDAVEQAEASCRDKNAALQIQIDTLTQHVADLRSRRRE